MCHVSHTTMTSCFLLEMKQDCHSYTDHVIVHNILPCLWSHSSYQADKRISWRWASTSLPKALSDDNSPWTATSLATGLVGLLSGRPKAGTQQQTTNFPLLGHSVQLLDNNWMVTCVYVYMETLQSTENISNTNMTLLWVLMNEDL
jgi:hypothetical protein